MTETRIAPKARYVAKSIELPNAVYVANSTMGLIAGAVTRNGIAVYWGTFFSNNRLTIGTIPHSQEGKTKPIKVPKRMARTLFWGRSLCTFSGVINTSIKPEIIAPINTKGKASMIIDRKIAPACRTEVGS